MAAITALLSLRDAARLHLALKPNGDLVAVGGPAGRWLQLFDRMFAALCWHRWYPSAWS